MVVEVSRSTQALVVIWIRSVSETLSTEIYIEDTSIVNSNHRLPPL